MTILTVKYDAALFYLRSRGIEATAARRMLIRAFIHGRLPAGELGDRLGTLLDAALVDLGVASTDPSTNPDHGT